MLKRIIIYSQVFALICLFPATTFAQRIVQNFDKDWRFFQGEASGAEQASYSDASWSKINVPHDWSIEGAYDQGNKTGRGGGYLPNGIAWYRKEFSVPDDYTNKKLSIEFDGVMANSEVWINGHYAGKRPFGYVSFFYDLTPYLKFGKNSKNFIAVKTDNSLQPASRWYSGAGIYRHVRLVATNPLHVAQWGVFITTPEVSKSRATIQIQTEIKNESATAQQISLHTLVFDKNGNQAGIIKSSQNISAGGSASIQQKLSLNNPLLWQLNDPAMYGAVTKIFSGKNLLDEQKNSFGIREARFDAATGFYLNGKNIKIKGVCLHHDAGAVGAAVPLRIWETRFEQLKSLGVNAIRTAHNPMAPEFYDLCDRMGLMVMDETFDTWTASKANAEQGYQLYFKDWWERDTRETIMRDRNHPSVIMYSIGNEIRDNLKDSSGFKTYRDQQDLIHRLDPTRPVTMAIFRPNAAGVYKNGFVEMMDVVGQNYREAELVAVHETKPQLKVIGTENGHTLDAWLVMRDKPYMAGQFLWTGIDYLGEAGWPQIGSGAGLIDRTGKIKPRGYERKSWWANDPVVYIVRNSGNAGAGSVVSDWTPEDFDTYDEAQVQVFSNCDEVELFLNENSLGSKKRPANDAARAWKVTFAKGTLKAVGKNEGKVVATHELRTASEPKKIILKADKKMLANDWNDVVYIRATVVDANGVICPGAYPVITFNISGPGEISAVDNGNNASHESYRGNQRKAFQGEAIAIIKATGAKGTINISGSAEGLASGTVDVEATNNE